jgi:hypothetical protein
LIKIKHLPSKILNFKILLKKIISKPAPNVKGGLKNPEAVTI